MAVGAAREQRAVDARATLGSFRGDGLLGDAMHRFFDAQQFGRQLLIARQFTGMQRRGPERAGAGQPIARRRNDEPAYELLGRDAKAAEMEALASDIRDALLDILWDDSPAGPPRKR